MNAAVRPSASHAGRTSSLLALALFGAVAARLLLSDHAPNTTDAVFCLAFTALIAIPFRLDRPLVLPAPFGSAAVVAVAWLFSVALSWHPYLSWLSLSSALCALTAFLAVGALGQRGRGAALFGLLAGGALSSTTALVQRFVTWPDALARQEELGLDPSTVARLASGRPLGLTLSPDLMSALALAGAVAGLALFSSRNPLMKAGAAALGVLSLAGLVVSQSAGGGLAAGVWLASWALIVVVRGLRGPAALFAVASALVVPVVLLLSLGRGLEQLTRSAGERVLNWQIGFDALLSSPVGGVGFGRFSAAYLGARTPDANVTRYAHSFFVQTLVEGGVLFGGLVLLVLLGGLLVLVRARVRGRPDRSRDVVLAGVVALLARAAYDYDLQVASTATAFAVLLGVAWVDAQKDGPVLAEGVVPATARRRTTLANGLLAFLLAFGVSTTALGVWRDAALGPFARGSDASTDDVDRLARYLARAPGDPHADALMARLLTGALLRCGSECDEAEARAHTFLDEERRSPPSHVAILEAVLAYRADDRAAMESAFERALAADPGSPEAHGLRVRFAREHGDPRLPAYEAEAQRWLPPAGSVSPRGR